MSMRSRGEPRDIRRRTRTRTERRAILIVSEGVRTEPDYFNGLARAERRSNITVHSMALTVVGTGRDPRRVVAEAKRQAQLAGADPFDSVWAVVDVDQHSNLQDAIIDAKACGVRVVISNPCFEVWLLMHFEQVTAFQDAKQLARRLSRHGLETKALPATFPYTNRAIAQQRARICDPHSARNRVGPNPSTAAHLVVEDIIR